MPWGSRMHRILHVLRLSPRQAPQRSPLCGDGRQRHVARRRRLAPPLARHGAGRSDGRGDGHVERSARGDRGASWASPARGASEVAIRGAFMATVAGDRRQAPSPRGADWRQRLAATVAATVAKARRRSPRR